MKIMVGAVMVVALLFAFSLGFYVKGQTAPIGPGPVITELEGPGPTQTPSRSEPGLTPIIIEDYLIEEPEREPRGKPIVIEDYLIPEPTPVLPYPAWIDEAPRSQGQEWRDIWRNCDLGQPRSFGINMRPYVLAQHPDPECRQKAQQAQQEQSDRRERERAEQEVQELKDRIDCLEREPQFRFGC